jgi:hypothetical protein
MTNRNNDWEFLKKNIYNTDKGEFRNILVYDMKLKDWNIFVDYLNTYNISFKDYQSELLYNKIDIEKLIEFWNGINEDGYMCKIVIEKININCFFNTIDFIEMDIDCSEFNSINEHAIFIDFLKKASAKLNKTIYVEKDTYNEEAKTLIEVTEEKVLIFNIYSE